MADRNQPGRHPPAPPLLPTLRPNADTRGWGTGNVSLSCEANGGGTPMGRLGPLRDPPFSGLFAVSRCPPGPHTTTRSPAPGSERAWRCGGGPQHTVHAHSGATAGRWRARTGDAPNIRTRMYIESSSGRTWHTGTTARGLLPLWHTFVGPNEGELSEGVWGPFLIQLLIK